jgi:hypothetical protein
MMWPAFAYSKLTIEVPSADQNEDVWKVQAYRDARIQMARDNERYSREALSPKPVTQDRFASGDDGHRHPIHQRRAHDHPG